MGMDAPGEYQPVDTSGRSIATSVNRAKRAINGDLPPYQETDADIVLQEDVKRPVKGWRLEQNSNGYWRWRYQAKGDDGKPVTYYNKSGKVAYKKGSQYVKLGELDDAREEEARLRSYE